ncbi:hypothetical protein GGR58DRAFT_464910 [Xylaria digitata]|nr:hypothetical protein GGR58DRAFT_464910 [Xylaria digitata]
MTWCRCWNYPKWQDCGHFFTSGCCMRWNKLSPPWANTAFCILFYSSYCPQAHAVVKFTPSRWVRQSFFYCSHTYRQLNLIEDGAGGVCTLIGYSNRLLIYLVTIDISSASTSRPLISSRFLSRLTSVGSGDLAGDGLGEQWDETMLYLDIHVHVGGNPGLEDGIGKRVVSRGAGSNKKQLCRGGKRKTLRQVESVGGMLSHGQDCQDLTRP